ncbi:3-deoxy-7-phosphoheptulonate synthase [Hippea maritima]|uniref:Phospho-2-dehydro-3-deoxyheptonate aldolase n=1 Tax=Hippea maritima (strain ATCC 700847 / DSM 10411 / MH2) TaxID=760142 RepID=F2LVP6_HIPMA|nr:3-deoxy-7-phosphoheptulonate synthase [Hippea maritima]AEA33830.1 phospho-2-dehydro-3-deoxyheptonate aldolase [Hippea maritima DSM 10411]
MIIIMKRSATDDDIERVNKKIEKMGLKAHISKGSSKTVIGVIGDVDSKIKEYDPVATLSLDKAVESVQRVSKPYKLASRESRNDDTIIDVKGVKVGGDTFTLIAGPCSVENREQVLTTARGIKKCSAHMLRGGAFKPRTSPYSFQGLGEEGLKLLKEASEETGLPVVTEVMNPKDLDVVLKYADVLQIGARNIQNFSLLKLVGQTDKPVLLKRGMATTIQEFLMSAEYVMSEGNADVMLCERGIRTFETATRNTLDISAVPVLKKETHLPVLIDPSHAAGKRDYVPALSRAAIAAGADGLLIEVHYNPQIAVSDAAQQLTIEEFCQLVDELRKIGEVVGKIIQ